MVSAIVFSFNDHKYVKDCISSLSFVNEVIVIGKIEQSVLSEIQCPFPVRYIESEFTGFHQLTKEAIKNVSYKWIVAIEANHCISKYLSQEIIKIVSDEKSSGIYNVKTRFNFMGKSMQYSGYRTSSSPLLWQLTVNYKTTPSKAFKNLIDEIYLDFDSYNGRLTEKAKQRARELFINQKRPFFLYFFLKPFCKLIINYVFKLGLLDGKEGFVFAYIKAFQEFKTYLFLWLMYRNLE